MDPSPLTAAIHDAATARRLASLYSKAARQLEARAAELEERSRIEAANRSRIALFSRLPEIVESYCRNGMTAEAAVAAAARAAGCEPATVMAWCRHARHTRLASRNANILALAASGMSTRAIGTRHDLSAAQVSRIIRAAGAATAKTGP